MKFKKIVKGIYFNKATEQHEEGKFRIRKMQDGTWTLFKALYKKDDGQVALEIIWDGSKDKKSLIEMIEEVGV